MNQELLDFIKDPQNPVINLKLALWYEKQRHFSPASGYFLRCAEFTDDQDLRYEALMKTAACYRTIGKRNYTVESLLKNAIAVCPHRPEAYYFLAQHYEGKNDWIDAYVYASLGLSNGTDGPKPTLSNIYFGGMYYLMLQKASSAWWIGKPGQAREIYQDMIDNHYHEMNKEFRDLLQKNVCWIGHGPEWESRKKYGSELHNRLRFQFNGSEEIEQNYSQAYQDLFVLAVYNGKKNGTYVEIGSAKAFDCNNSALLEKFGWTGFGVEFDQALAAEHAAYRKNPVLCENALDLDYSALFKQYFPNTNIIDYLQVDIEPAKNTYQCLFSIPFEDYKFGIITYEHDFYADVTRSYRSKSRKYLQSLGYELLVNDISVNGLGSFEDWWYHPELISPEKVKLMKSINLDKIHVVEEYMLCN